MALPSSLGLFSETVGCMGKVMADLAGIAYFQKCPFTSMDAKHYKCFWR